MIIIDLRKLRLASQEKMVENMTTVTAGIKAAIETSQAPARRSTSLGQGSNRNLS
jgi:hypothetical protein